MFSRDGASTGSVSTRSSRRRVRTSSDDASSLRPVTKRRKRSLLAPDTFEPPKTRKRVPSGGLTNGHAIANGHPAANRAQRAVSTDTTSLAIRNRGNKRSDRDKRNINSAEGVIQTRNSSYVVTQDLNIPEALQEILGAEPWQSEISSSLGHVVVTTLTQAIIWQYRPKGLSIAISKPLVIKLPHAPLKPSSPSTPLPLGILVHDAGAGEIALLIIMPLTGEAMYWESVKKVAITDQLRQRQHSIHGTVNGLHSGESITSINEAEPDGFVLTTSNGRIAHLTTRDSQGRPLISTQILKGANSSTGSFFGSITSVFSAAGWQREIAAVRAGPLHGKSQRSCVVATAQGSFQIWGLTRHSSKTLYFEINGKDEMFAAIQTTIGNVSEASKNDFKVLDFAMFPTSTKSGTTADAHRLLVLTVIKKGRSSLYNLVELRMKTGILEVDVVHPITCFSELQHEEPQWKVFKARVLLPDLAQTAVIVLDTSIVFISLARIEESPSSQLQMESNSLPETFQDVVYLRKAPGYHVVGCSIDEAEPKSSRGRCILLIHGFGIAEIALSAPNDDTAVSDKSAMTVTSKVEQAIFFGGLQDNLLDFNPERILFGTNSREIEAAVLNINKSIMRSTSEYIPAIMPSVDHQLKLRADALAEIIRYTARWELQPLTRWELLWSGEKLAAAKAVWQSFNTHLRTFRQGERLLLPELLDMMHQSLKVENQPEHGESDIVRHYLIHDVWRIENVVYWAQQAITELHKEGKIPDPVKQANFVSQADDIQIHALEAAFAFRAANFKRYGFNADLITDGVYQGSYEGLPQFWTSIPEIVEHVKMLTDLSRETAINNASSPTAEEGIDISLLTKLVQDNPRLVHICCRVYDEHCRWLQYQSDPNLKANGDGMRREFLKVRRELILKLVDLELPDNGIELAEKYGDMQALVDVMEKSAMLANERIGDAETSDSEKEDLTTKLNVWGDRMESYFDTYGSKWAHATYSKMISEGKCAGLFDEEVMRHRDFLTQYLRGKPELAKLSWINEVLAEENYAVSADNLIASQKVETNIWNKKVELSMGKLAHLAAQEKGQTEKGKTTDFLKKTDRRMAILDIQDQLYDYVEPALRDAVDEFAKLGLAMEQFCKFEEVSDAKKKKKKPTLFKLFQQNMKILISRQALDPEELIDTLTLIYKDPGVVDEEVMEDQFFLALKFLKLSGIQKQDFRRYDLLEKIIWRRCLIRDDWEAFNRTDMKTEEDMKFAKASTAFFQTLKACYEYKLFDDGAGPPPPTTVLGAGTTPELLRLSGKYANASEAFLKVLAHDLEQEDQALEKALEKGRLASWCEGLIKDVKDSIREDQNRSGEKEAERVKYVRELGEEMGVGGSITTSGDDGSGYVNGHTQVDEQGDIFMS